MNVDDYLTLAEIQAALARVTYRPGWAITAHPHPFEGNQLRIVAPAVPDSTNPAETVDLGIDDWIPPQPNLDALWRFLAWRLGRIEQHEMREWLKVDGQPIFDPHPEVSTAAEISCRCGHDFDAHEHYRRGTDCALCDCPEWKP